MLYIEQVATAPHTILKARQLSELLTFAHV